MLRFLHHAPTLSHDPQDNRIIFIDRDGVINVDPIGDYVKTWEDFEFEPGVFEALRLLTQKGYQIIVISNQAGIGEGLYSEADLRDIHRRMIAALEREGIAIRSAHYCLHGKQEGCKCRKPETGLFEDATHGLPFRKDKTYFIGDKKTDIEAGKRFGIKTVFVRTGHGKIDEAKLPPDLKPDIMADNLEEAILKLTL